MPTRNDLVLDTHVWIWLLLGRELAADAVSLIEQAGRAQALFISAITPWEIAMLAKKGRLVLAADTRAWVAQAIERSRVQVAPIEPDIAVDGGELDEFHGDPADRIIVATARHATAQLLSRDDRILRYGAAGHVRVLAV
jgi:PIN domain nuclease of toxin-antitoxin system